MKCYNCGHDEEAHSAAPPEPCDDCDCPAYDPDGGSGDPDDSLG